ncbi:MAG: hypothetical protein JW912_04820 [Sedimentisphaerales bacterium]|nr:hypothetical protein [Sedimentisphaerales bacterium]
MFSRTIIIVGFLMLLAPLASALEPAGTVAATQETEKVFPHIAEVVGTNVYIRSGAGTAYYFCGKVNSPLRLIVVEEKNNWAKIIPPKGSFSWISKKYVEQDEKNLDLGFVTGDNVRIWAGSDHVEPMRSHSLQTRLNRGDQVRLTGQEKDDYYKITPPPGAHLWINSKHLKYIGSVPKPQPLVLPPKPGTEPEPSTKTTVPTETVVQPKKSTVEIEQAQPEIAPAPIQISPGVNAKIVKCHELGKLILTEVKKPFEEQNYSEIKKQLEMIANDPDAGKAKFYAEYYLDQLDRYELAIVAEKELKQQQQQLDETIEQIKQEHSETVQNIPDSGRFAAIGVIKPSSVYTDQTHQKRFFIEDAFGKIICYAIPVKDAVKIDLDKYVKQKVGLIGDIQSDPDNPVSLVMFSGIELVE